MPDISIIVPVYKTEKYLPACVDSILAQTFTDFELLLIDDGSPDRSGEICDRYAARDRRVRAIHQENGGVTKARARGVEERDRHVQWIMFVDSDDTLPVTALADMHREAIAVRRGGECNIVIGQLTDKKYEWSDLSNEMYREEVINGVKIHNGPFAKLFAPTLFNEHTFDIPREIRKGEDALMNIRIAFVNTKPVRLLNKKVYNYRQHEQSCMHTFRNSVAYETMYHRYRMESIPVSLRDKYMKPCILSRLNGLIGVFQDQKRNVWTGTPFCEELQDDIRRMGYRPHWVFRIMLGFRNRDLIAAALTLNRIKNRLCRRFL